MSNNISSAGYKTAISSDQITPTIPVAGVENVRSLITAVTPPSGTSFNVTSDVVCTKNRLVHLFVTFVPGAAADVLSIIPEVAAVQVTGTATYSSSDVDYFPIAITDGSITNTDLPFTVQSSYSQTNFGASAFRPLVIQTAPADNTNPIKMAVTIDITGYNLVRFQFGRTVGNTGSPLLSLSYSLSM